jgi:uncharacterized protein (TIGR02246 family)
METKEAQQLYHQLINAWNSRDASAFANLFAYDGVCIGYDGSEMHGREEISTSLAAIFKNHPTAKYVSIVREVKLLGGDLCLVRAHVGMLPPGKTTVDSTKDAIQVMIVRADKQAGLIILFQNTPAQYHGRPEVLGKLTQELQAIADKS